MSNEFTKEDRILMFSVAAGGLIAIIFTALTLVMRETKVETPPAPVVADLSIGSLEDVQLQDVTNQQSLLFDGTTSRFVNKAIVSAPTGNGTVADFTAGANATLNSAQIVEYSSLVSMYLNLTLTGDIATDGVVATLDAANFRPAISIAYPMGGAHGATETFVVAVVNADGTVTMERAFTHGGNDLTIALSVVYARAS